LGVVCCLDFLYEFIALLANPYNTSAGNFNFDSPWFLGHMRALNVLIELSRKSISDEDVRRLTIFMEEKPIDMQEFRSGSTQSLVSVTLPSDSLALALQNRPVPPVPSHFYPLPPPKGFQRFSPAPTTVAPKSSSSSAATLMPIRTSRPSPPASITISIPSEGIIYHDLKVENLREFLGLNFKLQNYNNKDLVFKIFERVFKVYKRKK
jgi:hypothetical protein